MIVRICKAAHPRINHRLSDLDFLRKNAGLSLWHIRLARCYVKYISAKIFDTPERAS